MRTTIAPPRGTTGYDLDDEIDLAPRPTRRTPVTNFDHDWLSDIVAEWDEVFREPSTTSVRAVGPARRITTCLVGDRSATFAWLGTQRLVLNTGTPVVINWDVVVSQVPSTYFVPPALASAAALPPLEPSTTEVIAAVESVSRSLGVAERDVLAAAGIRDRTYYYWKRNPDTAARPSSQARLWAVVSSAAAIVAQLHHLAPRWLRADPARLEMFVDGQHERLALLAAAAAADVRIPSDTFDILGVEPSTDAERLKRFRTRHPVRFTHDEDGAPLVQATGLAAKFYADEPEDELIINDVDDE